MQAKDRIIYAVDTPDLDKAIPMIERLTPFIGCCKIGLELITAMLATIVSSADVTSMMSAALKIRKLFALLGKRFFWDGKFDDIPNTVGAASKVVSSLGARMFNVHASAGIEAMMAAVANRGQSEVSAVTVLTSFEENNAFLVFGAPSKAKVLQFARDAKAAGCVSVVCSPQELLLLGKQRELMGLRKVTPGIRSADDPADDQKRTMTPYEAIRAGADELVIGRPITQAKSPEEAAQRIAEQIRLGLQDRFHAAMFDLKKIQFGAFKLKLHELHPEKPLSPIYLNIRDLPEWMYVLAGDILHDLIVQEGIDDFDYIIGIPKAGEPIGRALAKAVGKPFLRIEKVEAAGSRKITSTILDPFEKGKRVLLVDDLITHAETKLEAIASVEANDLKVTATVVIYDREQGGLKELNAAGRKTYAVAPLSETLDFFVREKKIPAAKKDEVMAYIAAN